MAETIQKLFQHEPSKYQISDECKEVPQAWNVIFERAVLGAFPLKGQQGHDVGQHMAWTPLA